MYWHYDNLECADLCLLNMFLNKINKGLCACVCVWADQSFMSAHVSLILETARIRVDPVYAALRYGTSLAQMSRSSFGSLSESPTRSVV